MKVITNNVPRDVLSAFELTPKELAEFDYLAEGEGSFFRYRGEIYDLGEFLTAHPDLSDWDGMRSDSYFSGLVVRYVDDYERVVVGLALC